MITHSICMKLKLDKPVYICSYETSVEGLKREFESTT